MNDKPDLIVSWPKNCDYPLWRKFITDYRSKFSKVIVVFTEAPIGFDYSNFVTYELGAEDIIFKNSPTVRSGQDWRDVAVCYGLGFSQSDWVFFTEQDFYPKSEFFDEVDEHCINGANVIAVYQGDRMHPCAMFMRFNDLANFYLDFGVKSGEYDHFGRIQKQIEEKGLVVGKISPQAYHHFNGLSHNWRLVSEGQKPNYKPDEFIQYLKDCWDSGVVLHWEFKRVANKAILAYLL